MTARRTAFLDTFLNAINLGNGPPTHDLLARTEAALIEGGALRSELRGWAEGIEKATASGTRLARAGAAMEAFKTEITRDLLNGGFTFTEAMHVGGVIQGLCAVAARAEGEARERERLDGVVKNAIKGIDLAFKVGRPGAPIDGPATEGKSVAQDRGP